MREMREDIALGTELFRTLRAAFNLMEQGRRRVL
jgi:hypothetical protein